MNTVYLVANGDLRLSANQKCEPAQAAMEKALGANYDRLMERRAKATPLQRCATADDVGATAVALATSMRFTTGQTIVIDGGYSAVN